MTNTRPRLALLLTASIDPRGMSLTRRADPRTREADYLAAIDFWRKNTDLPIVFCENSGYGLSKIREALGVEHPAPAGVHDAKASREVLQFDGQHFPRELGKGYGELLIIRHALERSKLLAQADYIVKVTGRYRVENLQAILAPLSSGDDIYVLADHKKGNDKTYSAVFACKPEFISDYLAPLQETIDDSKLQTLEVVLSRAIDRAISDGKVCLPFSVKPIVSGVSGTWNVRIDPADPNRIVFSWPRFEGMVKAYFKAAIRRSADFFKKN